MIMTKPRIIVTGATGKTGRVVVTELLKAGYPVRAMVHREDGRSARLKAQGAEICKGISRVRFCTQAG
jgi:NAD(P)H dehydrogenase (quinone)